MYIIHKNIGESTWNNFFDENGSPSFLHAWEWGELQKSLGHEVLRLGIHKQPKNDLIGVAQVLKMKTRRGKFIFIPHGPVFKVNCQLSDIKEGIGELTKYLADIAKKEKFAFIRISPVFDDIREHRQTFSDVGYKKAPIYMHAERMWVVPLVKPVESAPIESGSVKPVEPVEEKELLAQMRKTTRYCIKKAARDGVTIEQRTDETAVDDFWKIYEHTAERERFKPFSKRFITEEFQAFHKTGNAVFLFAKVNKNSPPFGEGGVPTRLVGGVVSEIAKSNHNVDYLASALIIFTKSTAFYHQGASIHSKIPAPYLLQWEAIRLAKKRGCHQYNFWGIHQPGRTPKNWGGLSLFKQGFGGKQIDYLPAQDFIISKKYYLTFLYEKYLARKRGV